MENRSVNVEYEGAEFLVTGEWIEGHEKSYCEPEELSGFDEYKILFGMNTEGTKLYDIWELLTTAHQEAILELAENEIRGRDERV